jgi:hypothetical protein
MTRSESHPGIRNRGSGHRFLALGTVIVSCIAGAVGCNEGKACERQRLDVAKAGNEVNQAAEDAKVAGGDEMQWANIQKKLGVLQSAFATSQVTWDSANKNRDEATTLVGQISGSPSKTEIFRGTFNAAGAKQVAYYESCR